jgi:4'-phosphopantetheinyl transferase
VRPHQYCTFGCMERPGRSLLDHLQVHLWMVRLEASEDNFARSLGWLSNDEVTRAKRFYFDRHRHAFVLGRAALRALLANYLGRAPAEVAFVYGPQGKPALAPTPQNDTCPLRFNVSNSGNLAAYAFTIGCEIGVDVEQHRELHDFENIAHRFFSPEETAELLELPAAEKNTAFFNCWARKEAYIKAMGGGLSIALDSFQVTLRPGAAARMVSIAGSHEAARRWTLHEFTPAPDCAGAIAYPDELRSLHAGPILSVDELLGDVISK